MKAKTPLVKGNCCSASNGNKDSTLEHELHSIKTVELSSQFKTVKETEPALFKYYCFCCYYYNYFFFFAGIWRLFSSYSFRHFCVVPTSKRPKTRVYWLVDQGPGIDRLKNRF